MRQGDPSCHKIILDSGQERMFAFIISVCSLPSVGQVSTFKRTNWYSNQIFKKDSYQPDTGIASFS